MRLLPRSLFGRMVLILLVGLVAAQVLSAALSLYERETYFYRIGRVEAAQRIAEIVKLLDSLSIQERRRIVEVLDTPRVRIILDVPVPASGPVVPAAAGSLGLFQSNLRDYLGADRAIRVNPGDSPLANPAVEVKLKDGSWVGFYQRPRPHIVWPRRLLANLLILLMAMVLLLLVAVRWVTRPLSLLADAAEQLGKNINRPPLAEEGPIEVQRAARAFNHMQVRLVRYMQNRSRILAAMSHDLKTPITRLRLRTELLDDAELKTRFAKDLEEMGAMVSATLDFMRGVDKPGVLQPVDIMALLESLQADAGELGQQVLIEGTTSRPFACDPQALKRCVGNLVENAVKYGKKATISVEDNPARLQI